MIDLAAIRDELALAVASAAPELNVYDGPGIGAELPLCEIGDPVEIDYHTSYAGGTVTLPLTFVVPAGSEVRTATATLDGYMSLTAGSVLAALEAADAVADVWQEITADRGGAYRDVEIGQTRGIAADLTLNITT